METGRDHHSGDVVFIANCTRDRKVPNLERIDIGGPLGFAYGVNFEKSGVMIEGFELG